MAAQLQIQTVGNANSTPAENELNTLARRFVIRPQDFRSLGSYSTAGSFIWCNAMTTQPAPTSGPIMCTIKPQNTAGTIYLIRRVSVQLLMFQLATGTGANVLFPLSLVRVENFGSQFVVGDNGTASAAAGAVKQLSPSVGCRLATDMPPPTLDIILPPDAAAGAHAATLLAPVIQSTLATVIPLVATAEPLAQVNGFGVNAASLQIIPYCNLTLHPGGEYPIVLEPMSGLAINLPMATTPTFATAAATVVFGMAMRWDELQLRDYDP